MSVSACTGTLARMSAPKPFTDRVESTVAASELETYLASLLQVSRFHDYCPNGLQVEGTAAVHRLVTGVSASLALIEAAIEARADALLVHHGYFWRNEDPCMRRGKRERIARLLAADINLFAYHLPLDAHPELGNNAQLGQKLGLLQTGRTGENDLIAIGQWDAQSAEASVGTLGELARQVELALGRTPLLLGDPARPVRHVAWCSGGAQSYFEEAIASGVDVFITGEVSEPNYHLAIESGVGFIAAGHHATERFGEQALGAHLALHFGVEHQYIDIANPI